jgi:cytochrome P450
MACFFLAMILFPDAQRKAQEEIDRVIGGDRLPTFDDRDNLPYINAIVKEILRWHPVAPMGVPHVSTDDDVYEGYLIPKGALILPNIWYVLFVLLSRTCLSNCPIRDILTWKSMNRLFTHDPQTYHDPMSFKPERFLGPTPERDPATLSFGFGRRICPGRVLADTNIYLSVAQSLATFTMAKAMVNGKVVEPVVEFQGGVISHPAPYQISIKPRSPAHEALIRSVERVHPWEESDSKFLANIAKS